eukprot:SM000024S07841  [mRNA]  locus=s24:864801:869547:- [translate_table: standard]
MFQCGNGHVLCEQCLANVAACPTCKLPLSAPIRNLALEHIVDAVRVSCSHCAGGCSVRLRVYELEEHMLRACDHRPVPCPACGAQVWPQELGRHLLHEHAARCAEGLLNGGSFAGSIAGIDFIVFGYSVHLGQQLLHLDRSLDHLILAYLSTTKSPNKLEDHTYTLSIQSNTAASDIGLASEPAGPSKPALKLSMEGAFLHSLRADTQVRHARDKPLKLEEHSRMVFQSRGGCINARLQIVQAVGLKAVGKGTELADEAGFEGQSASLRAISRTPFSFSAASSAANSSLPFHVPQGPSPAACLGSRASSTKSTLRSAENDQYRLWCRSHPIGSVPRTTDSEGATKVPVKALLLLPHHVPVRQHRPPILWVASKDLDVLGQLEGFLLLVLVPICILFQQARLASSAILVLLLFLLIFHLLLVCLVLLLPILLHRLPLSWHQPNFDDRHFGVQVSDSPYHLALLLQPPRLLIALSPQLHILHIALPPQVSGGLQVLLQKVLGALRFQVVVAQAPEDLQVHGRPDVVDVHHPEGVY